MNIAWIDFGNAFALMLIFEGLMPFLSPTRLRFTYTRIIALDNRILRGMGFSSMLFGVLLLTLLRS